MKNAIKKTFVSTVTAAGILAAFAGSTVAYADEDVTLKLGVVGSIYEDLWAPAKEALKEEGIDLEIVQFSDFVTPNNALANGEIDLNAFQHQIYLESEIEEYGYELTDIGNTFIVPLNLYSDKVTSVDEIKDGDTIAIPNDLTNGGRAIKVLAAAGLITLKEDADFSPTLDDIETYNVDIEIEELAANTIPSALADVTAAVVNGNYALDFGLKTEEAIFQDTSVDEQKYWALIAARTEDLSDPDKVELYDKVVKAFQTDATESVFNDTFGGYFIAEGWDEDLLAEYK
jgi:D-methionine transport system substrate-binding protein